MPTSKILYCFWSKRANAILQYKHIGFPPFTYSTGTNPLHDRGWPSHWPLYLSFICYTRIHMTKERSGLIRLSMAFVEESDIGVYGLRVFNEHGKAYLFCLFICLLLFIYYCCLLNNRWGLLWGCPCLRRPRGQSRSIFGRLLPRLRQVFRFRPAHALAWQTFDRLDVRHPCHLDLETRPALGTQLGTLLCGRDGWIPRWWLEWGT